MRFAILDVDDVLLQTGDASQRAMQHIQPGLLRDLGELDAERVRNSFERLLRTLRSRLHSSGEPERSYRELRERLEVLQEQITSAGYDLKEWSRQSLLACALIDCGIRPTRRLVENTADLYWDHVESFAMPFPDVPAFLAELRSSEVRVHLATNSDGFLRFKDGSGRFTYDPEYSRKRKLKRLSALWDLGFEARNVTIGDPLGKSNQAFFRQVLSDFSESAGEPIVHSLTFVVGDSLHSDVIPFLELGVPLGVWLRRSESSPPTAVSNGVMQVTGLSWSEISREAGRLTHR